MNTESWLKVSGCDESKILTDLIYCSALTCGLCSRLLSLDAAVATCCNQPFCYSCLEEYAAASAAQDQLACPCARNHNKHIMLELTSLKSAQPIAFDILKLTKVECLHDSCTWTGCYGEFTTHLNGHQKKDVEPRVLNNSISKMNSHTYKKERYNSKSAFVHEAKYSEKSTHEEILKFRKMRSYSIDSTYGLILNFDAFETHHGNADDASPSRGESNHSHEETKEAEMCVKAEKLKKHANAKFNAGNYIDACALYTQGINMVKGVIPATDDDLQLLSDMYSNRAATFYLYKQFDECILDCEDAIRYDPTLEKPWIRKWRSLMVKGAFHDAHFFLEEAVDSFPESTRIRDEYDKSVKEMGLINLLERCVVTGDRIDIEKEMHKSLDISSCENVLLLQCYADVMISVGDANGVAKYIDRALHINPTHPDCLERQGICHFYNGNMKEAVRILTDACQEKSSIKLKETLKRVQNCYTLHSKAKIQTLHGRHDEAEELLTALIRECEPLPPKSLLFSLLRVDRANNSLLMHKHLDVLQDCKEVIDVNREFAPIWIIRADVLLAMGKETEARTELMHIRKTWGAGERTIEAKYCMIDFEFRMSRANNDVVELQQSLANGTCDILPVFRFSDPLGRKTSHSKRCKRSNLSKKDIHSNDAPVAKSSEPCVAPSNAAGKSSETLDRRTSHSNIEKSSDDRPVMVNRNESLSQSLSQGSFHANKNSSNDSSETCQITTSRHPLQRKAASMNEGTSGSTRKRTLQRKSGSMNEGTRPTLQRKSSMYDGTRPTLQQKSSMNEGIRPTLQRKSSMNEGASGSSVRHMLQRKSSMKEGTSGSNGRHILQRKSSMNEQLNRSFVVSEEPKVRRQVRRAGTSTNTVYSTVTLENHSKSGLSDEAPKRRRRSSVGAEKDDKKTSMISRKTRECHKSLGTAEFRQLHRLKTLDAIFGCDWTENSTSTINVKPDHSKRPETRRSQSDDILELRKALTDDYCGNEKK